MQLCKYGCGKSATHQLKDGSWMCEDSKNKCPINRHKNSIAGRKPIKFKTACSFCKKLFASGFVKTHESTCYLNPKNLKLCPMCTKPIKAYKGAKTCSHKCANNMFKYIGKDHWNYKGNDIHDYRKICFKYHKKKCIVCNEIDVVAVHHYDNDKTNNDPRNLVPLCPTHHLYQHTNRLIYVIKECVDEYHKNFSENFGGVV